MHNQHEIFISLFVFTYHTSNKRATFKYFMLNFTGMIPKINEFIR